MASQAVQAQWSLNETSDSVYSITRGVLQAATSDNVQPLAIMACEQFGNTIAISQETRLRIERTVLPTPEPVTIRFLKAKVGFMKHDCAVQLGSNQAGLRFLALAAALLACIPPYQCARALALMLESTTSDKRLLPTTRHLTDLMSSLESRCLRSGFEDIVIGYNSVIVGECRKNEYPYDEQGDSMPDSEGLSALVDACRSLQRVGDQGVRSVIVETQKCAAWVAAFAKWSLETPPSIYFDDKKPIFHQPGSQFTIVLRNGFCSGITIKVAKTCRLDAFQDLVVQYPHEQEPNYYISAQAYGFSLLGLLLEHDQYGIDAMLAALPLAITIARNSGGTIADRGLQNLEDSLPFTTTQPNCFPSIDILFKTMSFIFGLNPDFPFVSLASAKSFLDLPQVEHYLSITRDHRISPINYVVNSPLWVQTNNTSQPGLLSIGEFAGKLAIASYSILLLSLVENIEDLYLPTPRLSEQNSALTDNHRAVLEILMGRHIYWPITLDDITGQLHNLLITGHLSYQHPPSRELGGSLAWSTRSQVFWYSVLDDFTPRSTGVYSIASCRGRLMLDREIYDTVVDDKVATSFLPDLERFPDPERFPDFSAQNFRANLRIRWEVTTTKETIYVLLRLISHHQAGEMYGSVSAIRSIDWLMKCVLVNCEHQMNSSIGDLVPGMSYVFPHMSEPPSEDQKIVRVFPTGGVGELQMYCLGWVSHLKGVAATAVRQRACLSCCIAASERMKCEYLIL